MHLLEHDGQVLVPGLWRYQPALLLQLDEQHDHVQRRRYCLRQHHESVQDLRSCGRSLLRQQHLQRREHHLQECHLRRVRCRRRPVLRRQHMHHRLLRKSLQLELRPDVRWRSEGLR